MSTLGGMLRRASRPTILGVRCRKNKSRSTNWLPRDKWEAKLKEEGKWVDYKKK